MNDTEMIECREPALQMQRLIAIMKRLARPPRLPLGRGTNPPFPDFQYD